MLGTSISMFGSRISTIAFPMLVLKLYDSPLITGLVACAVVAPSMLVYMPAGVLVDRYNPRRIMLASETLRGLIISSLVFSLVSGARPNLLLLIAAMISDEILEIFSTLADRRYLNGLMEYENLASRQAYVEVRSHTVVLAGRPVGPFLFSISAYLPFLADAVSFLFSIGSLLAVRSSEEPPARPRRISWRDLCADVGHGFAWLTRDHRARLTIMFMALASLVAQALILILLAQAHAKQLSTFDIGCVLAASGAGGAAGSIVSKFMPGKAIATILLPGKIKGSWLTLQMLAWSAALAISVLFADPPAACSAVAMFVLGFTGAIGNIEFGTYLVLNVPDGMIAKVTGFGQMVAIGACAVGPAFGGAAYHYFGIRGAIGLLLLITLPLLAMSWLSVPDRETTINRWNPGPFRCAQALPVSAGPDEPVEPGEHAVNAGRYGQ
jgi:hypothetical protein